MRWRWLGLGGWTLLAGGAVAYALFAWPAPDLNVMTPAVEIVPQTVAVMVPMVETYQVVVTATPTLAPTPSPMPTDQPLPAYVWPTAAPDGSCYWQLVDGCLWQTPPAAPTTAPLERFAS